jgi:hypothetical protein
MNAAMAKANTAALAMLKIRLITAIVVNRADYCCEIAFAPMTGRRFSFWA